MRELIKMLLEMGVADGTFTLVLAHTSPSIQTHDLGNVLPVWIEGPPFRGEGRHALQILLLKTFCLKT
jgi:hypothetical protein